MWFRQGKLEQKGHFKPITDEFKQKFGAICEKYKIPLGPELEPPDANSKVGADLQEIPSGLTNRTLDDEGEKYWSIYLCSILGLFITEIAHSQKCFPSYSHAWLACHLQSFTGMKINQTVKGISQALHKFLTEMRRVRVKFKKGRNPVVIFEVKEDQKFDVHMLPNRNQTTTCWKPDIRHLPPSSDGKSPLDLQLAPSTEMKRMIQIKSHTISVVVDSPKKIQPIQAWFQESLHADHCSANHYKSVEAALENGCSSPNSTRTSKVYLNEELQQDMQRFKHEIGMLPVGIPALEQEKIHLQKDVELHLLWLWFLP